MKNKLFNIILIVFAISLITTLLFFLLNSRVKPTGYGKEFLIGMSQCNQAEPYRAQMNEDIKNAALKYNNAKVVFTDARQDNNKQIQDIKNLMDMGIDLLIVSPNESAPLTAIISEVHKTTPVIVLDRKINTDDYTVFIGSDNYLIGQKAGEYVTSLYRNKKINVLEIAGLLGSTPAIERSQGFYDTISANENITIAKKITANWLRDTAEDKMLDFLSSDEFDNTIDVVYSHNDPMAYGAYKALTKMNIPIDYIIGIDGLAGETGGIELVKNGIIDLTFMYPTGGYEAIEYAIKILNKESILEKNIILDAKVIK